MRVSGLIALLRKAPRDAEVVYNTDGVISHVELVTVPTRVRLDTSALPPASDPRRETVSVERSATVIVRLVPRP
jgi:hypothetical protein